MENHRVVGQKSPAAARQGQGRGRLATARVAHYEETRARSFHRTGVQTVKVMSIQQQQEGEGEETSLILQG